MTSQNASFGQDKKLSITWFPKHSSFRAECVKSRGKMNWRQKTANCFHVLRAEISGKCLGFPSKPTKGTQNWSTDAQALIGLTVVSQVKLGSFDNNENESKIWKSLFQRNIVEKAMQRTSYCSHKSNFTMTWQIIEWRLTRVRNFTALRQLCLWLIMERRLLNIAEFYNFVTAIFIYGE